MKTPLITLLLLNSLAFAVERPRGFAGIAWGASPEEAKRVLQARPGVKFPEESDDYHVEVTGGTFAGQPVVKWVLEFPERKFASASVTLKTETNASAIYKDFRTQLISKYGSATTEKKLANSPTVRKAYPAPTATALGSTATWKFTPTMKEKSSIVVSAELAGVGGKPAADENGLAVTIKYVNQTLAGTQNSNGPAKIAHAPVRKEDL